ncbi:MAG: site-specific DNA-methyltransferase [Myxococcota bacterium]|nr:site-specific DNA-methyltransferase [Myxococcota bacterium]
MPVLTFKGKTAAEGHHHTVPHHTLELDRKLSALDKDEAPSLDGNLVIEGDNLLALKALLPTHAARVKCIYIDPPYNTGNENWVYNDNLTQPQFKEWIGHVVGKEGEDGTRHDKWCCMMYPRLSLLREMLREDGAIFISIDDNEAHHLRALMDEVFGANNFVATIIWQKVYSPKSSARFFSESHDYVVVYAKNMQQWARNLLPRTEEQDARYKNPDNDPRGPWKPSDVSARNYYSKGRYPVTCPDGRHLDGPPPGTYWRVSEDELKRLDADHRIWWGEDGNNVPALKRFLSEVQGGLVPQTIWTYGEVGHTQDAKKEYLEILAGTEVFTTPKPVALVKRIIGIATEADDIVLDSFAGSGTTGHAVLDLNREDGGNRRFVLVQMPYDTKENEKDKLNICERITAERLRRVIRGYTAVRRSGKNGEKKRKVEGLGGSFTYARLGKPLFGHYRNWADKPPPYDDLARYIFFTETSREFDAKTTDAATGRIGEWMKTTYYLLYTPDPKASRALDKPFLAVLEKDANPRKVVYCEKVWIHRGDLQGMRDRIGEVRTMIVPFQVK